VRRVGGVVLGLVLLAAAGFKLADLGGFRATIARFGIVLDGLVPATALALVTAEVVLGLGLLLGRRWALYGALLLLLLFLAVLTYGLQLGLEVDCGCFGPGEEVGLLQALWRDLVLLALGGYLWWRHRRERREVRR
jgi:putative oxidoreductase